VADAVAAELRELGIEVVEDDSAGPADAGAGNLIARVPGTGDEWVAFFAHLDTVPHPEPVEVELVDGVFRSRGETILGADNKAAVTVIAELAARHVGAPAPAGLELVFTVAEEEGLRGAKEVDLAELRSTMGFVFDHASPIGEVITAAPTYQRLQAHFEGSEAHAGIRPEDGRSAIVAAAAAVGAMRLGRLDDETTANVGVIAGGTATNVVAGDCRIDCEARSLSDSRAAVELAAMVDACTWAASKHECDVDLEITEMFRAYRLSPSAAPLRLARAALERCGIEPREVVTGGGSDANALIARGFDCVLLANGTEANHTPQESVAAGRIVEMLAVCEAITELPPC
jgi:tripeptide aminopeptidase